MLLVTLVVTRKMTPGLRLALRRLKVVLAGWPGQCETPPPDAVQHWLAQV